MSCWLPHKTNQLAAVQQWPHRPVSILFVAFSTYDQNQSIFLMNKTKKKKSIKSKQNANFGCMQEKLASNLVMNKLQNGGNAKIWKIYDNFH